MSRSPQLRVVIVGRGLSIAPLEEALIGQGASKYVCVDTLDAADWLIQDGFDADLMIVHHALLPKASDLMQLRRRNPHAIVLPSSSRCDMHEVRNALTAALRRRREAAAASRAVGPGLFAAFGRRLALG